MSKMQAVREALALGHNCAESISKETGLSFKDTQKALNNLVSLKQAHRTGWLPRVGKSSVFGVYAPGEKSTARPIASVWELGDRTCGL